METQQDTSAVGIPGLISYQRLRDIMLGMALIAPKTVTNLIIKHEINGDIGDRLLEMIKTPESAIRDLGIPPSKGTPVDQVFKLMSGLYALDVVKEEMYEAVGVMQDATRWLEDEDVEAVAGLTQKYLGMKRVLESAVGSIPNHDSEVGQIETELDDIDYDETHPHAPVKINGKPSRQKRRN